MHRHNNRDALFNVSQLWSYCYLQGIQGQNVFFSNLVLRERNTFCPSTLCTYEAFIIQKLFSLLFFCNFLQALFSISRLQSLICETSSKMNCSSTPQLTRYWVEEFEQHKNFLRLTFSLYTQPQAKFVQRKNAQFQRSHVSRTTRELYTGLEIKDPTSQVGPQSSTSPLR